MKASRALLFIILAILLPLNLRADISQQDARFEKLPEPVGSLPAGSLEGMARALARTNPLGFAEWKEIKDGPAKGINNVLRLATRKPVDKPWLLQTTARVSMPVKKGDMLLAIFYARGEFMPSDSAECHFVFEQARDPWRKSVTHRVDVEKDWQKFYVPFLAVDDYEPGTAQVSFHAGFGPQIVQIADLRVLNFAKTVKYGDLPYTPLTYRGRAASSEWRAEAEKRIENYRKATLTIRVHSSKGKSIPGAEVRIRQVRHAYGFGSAIDSASLLAQSEDGEAYRAIVESSFNKVTLENDLKWPQWEESRQKALDALAWTTEKNIPVRGHVLLWPGWKNLPQDLAELATEPAKLKARILAHIRDIATATKGLVSDWDVVNEPYSNTDVQKVLGDSILVDAFKTTREVDPKARLFINDYGILSHGGTDSEHQDAYFKTIQTLKAAGAPIGGIGMQGHFDEQLTSPARVWEILDRFATFGIPIHITEHDINVWDEEAWADYTRDFMTACFAHPATSAFITWGFWEGRHWIPNAAYWTKDWQPRPAAKVWYELVFKKWWTNVRSWTDYRGRTKAKCFLGDYIIEVKYGTMKTEKPITLKRGGDYVEIELRPPPKEVPAAAAPAEPVNNSAPQSSPAAKPVPAKTTRPTGKPAKK